MSKSKHNWNAIRQKIERILEKFLALPTEDRQTFIETFEEIAPTIDNEKVKIWFVELIKLFKEVAAEQEKAMS